MTIQVLFLKEYFNVKNLRFPCEYIYDDKIKYIRKYDLPKTLDDI